jgi:hypothetical protein
MYHKQLRGKKKDRVILEWDGNAYTFVGTFPGFDRHHVQAPMPKTKLQMPTTV